MANQYEKRKAREAELLNEVSKKREAKRKKINTDLTNIAFDIIKDEKGKYLLVVIKYNSATKLAEVQEIKPLGNRALGLMFEQKKTALKTLSNIK